MLILAISSLPGLQVSGDVVNGCKRYEGCTMVRCRHRPSSNHQTTHLPTLSPTGVHCCRHHMHVRLNGLDFSEQLLNPPWVARVIVVKASHRTLNLGNREYLG